MPLKPIQSMPDDARLWSFGCSRPLNDAEELEFLGRVDGFLGAWHAHGHPLDVARDWLHGRLLVVAVDERTAPPSGCSIDALVRTLHAEGERMDAELIGNATLWFRDQGGAVRRATRAEFGVLAQEGSVNAETPVFDFTVTRVGQLRNGEWETRAGDAWHARAFALESGAHQPG